VNGQDILTFNSLESLFQFAEENSYAIKTNKQNTILAKYQKLAALANIVNFRNPLVFTMTDNTKLAKTFVDPHALNPSVPAGGPLESITLGIQYVSNANITPQIDIINPANWSQVKSASINEVLTSTQNKLNKKALYESIAACYYNIISYKEQIEVTRKNLSSTDSILTIVKNKFDQGLVRQKDVNDATINKLSLQDKFNQLNISLEQQYNSLKILCDIPSGKQLIIEEKLNYDQQFETDLEASSQLQFMSSLLQMEYAKNDYRNNLLSNLPVVSLLYNTALYQNSNVQFYDPNAKWLNAVYYGAKLSWNIPDITHIVSSSNSKVSYHIAKINFEHNKLQNDINNNQLILDYEKYYSQYSANKQILSLKADNYRMASNQFSESILPVDNLLNSFNDMLVSRLNYCSVIANLAYTRSKIDINNKIK
jgi:OMF family outer membrane factor